VEGQSADDLAVKSTPRVDFCLGGAVSLTAPGILVTGGSDLVAIALLAVFVVGLIRVVQAGLDAMRAPRNPLWRVVASGGSYWCGAAVSSIAAWNVAFAVLVPDLELGVGLGDLRQIWIGAAVSVAVVACVTTVVHSLRSRA
jgi:hypothetical protein